MYSLVIKPFLFLFPPEFAHLLAMNLFRLLLSIPGVKTYYRSKMKSSAYLPLEVCGLSFRNPVGLAAGFDKNAKYLDILPYLGFGFLEIGTVTPKPQQGNPKPRLFRLPKDQALINRMGFNNEGVDVVVKRLKKYKGDLIIGGNIGKNKITPNEKAVEDYLYCFQKLYPYVDYFVVNVSSPNTPDLRQLQEKGPLTEILRILQAENQGKIPKPIFLKIAPDLNQQQLIEIVEIVNELKIAGLIINNTTISREGLKTKSQVLEKIGAGGLSGQPVKKMSDQVLSLVKKEINGQISIIGVGGITTDRDALHKFELGADLIQIYTGFIYKGPELVYKILEKLRKSPDLD